MLATITRFVCSGARTGVRLRERDRERDCSDQLSPLPDLWTVMIKLRVKSLISLLVTGKRAHFRQR